MAKKKYAPFTIIRDSREQTGWNFRASANCNGMKVTKLDTGDYSIEGYEHLIMIERKSINDLWMTLTKERARFIREMERAKEIPARYLIIEGSLKDIQAGHRFSSVRPDFIIANLFSLQQKYGVHVIFTDKRNDVCQPFVRKLLEKLYQYCEDGFIRRDSHE